MDSHERCEKACEVLRRTNDGDDLYGPHLGIIQALVNNKLTDEGMTCFVDSIYTPVMAGTYAPPAFHDVANLTYDGLGYVRWKGIIVEHFSPGFAYSERSRAFAQALGSAAANLEAAGEQVTWCSVIEYVRRQCWTYSVC